MSSCHHARCFSQTITSSVALSGGKTGYQCWTTLPSIDAIVSLRSTFPPSQSKVGKSRAAWSSRSWSLRMSYGRWRRSCISAWYSGDCVETPNTCCTPSDLISENLSRKEQACGVQPRAPGIEFQLSGTVSFGAPVKYQHKSH